MMNRFRKWLYKPKVSAAGQTLFPVGTGFSAVPPTPLPLLGDLQTRSPSPPPDLSGSPPNPAWCKPLLLLPSNPGALAAAPAGCRYRPLVLPSRVLRVPSSHLVVADTQPEQTTPPLLLLGSGKTSPAPLAAAAMTPAFLFCAPSPLSWTRNVPPALFPLRPCLPAIRNGPSLRFLQVLERALISVSFPGPGRTPSCLCPERVPIPLPEPGPIRA